MGNITLTYYITDMNDAPPSHMINYVWLTSKSIAIMKPHVFPGSIFLIYGWEFHKLSFSKHVSAVQKARNRKKKSLNIPERMVKRKRTLGQTMVYKKLQIIIKHLATRTTLLIEGELVCSGRVSSFCSTCNTRRSIRNKCKAVSKHSTYEKQ